MCEQHIHIISTKKLNSRNIKVRCHVTFSSSINPSALPLPPPPPPLQPPLPPKSTPTSLSAPPTSNTTLNRLRFKANSNHGMFSPWYTTLRAAMSIGSIPSLYFSTSCVITRDWSIVERRGWVLGPGCVGVSNKREREKGKGRKSE